jgi:hypothetical protein
LPNEGLYWFSLQESNSEDDDDDFEDKYSTPAPVWCHTTSDSQRGFKLMWNSNKRFEEIVMEAAGSAVGMQMMGESIADRRAD